MHHQLSSSPKDFVSRYSTYYLFLNIYPDIARKSSDRSQDKSSVTFRNWIRVSTRSKSVESRHDIVCTTAR